MALPKISILSDAEKNAFREFLNRYDFSAGDENIFSWYDSLPGTTMFVAKTDGKIVGTGISYSLGRTGWIGTICVDEGHRKKGIGRALTEVVIDTLENQGSETILLRASEEGAKLYRSMGFRVTGRYENFLPPDSGWSFDSGDGHTFREMSTLGKQHLELDREITGEDREPMLARLFPATGYELVEGNEMKGFVFPSVGDGILGFSGDGEAVNALMARISNGRHFKIRTLVGSKANSFLHSLGHSTRDGAIRMSLGEDPLKRIKNVVGTISSSIG